MNRTVLACLLAGLAAPLSAAAQNAGRYQDYAPELGYVSVRDVQQRLTELGFDTGPIDGNAGGRTRAAIENYQRLAELPVTGIADQALLNDLRFRDPPVRIGSRTPPGYTAVYMPPAALPPYPGPPYPGQPYPNSPYPGSQIPGQLPPLGPPTPISPGAPYPAPQYPSPYPSQYPAPYPPQVPGSSYPPPGMPYPAGQYPTPQYPASQYPVSPYPTDPYAAGPYAAGQFPQQAGGGVGQFPPAQVVTALPPARTAVPAASRAEVTEAQFYLKQLGYYRGAVDGVSGPQTRDAVARYQAAAGLPADSRITPALVDRLRAEGGGTGFQRP